MRFIFLLIFFADMGIFGLFEYSLNTNHYGFSQVMDIDKFRNNFAMIASFSIFIFFIYTPTKNKKIKPKIAETVPPISEDGEEEAKDNKNEKKQK